MPRLIPLLRATRATLATNHSEAKVFAINFPKLTGCLDKHSCLRPGQMLAKPFLARKYFVKYFTNFIHLIHKQTPVRQNFVGVWLRVWTEPADDLARSVKN